MTPPGSGARWLPGTRFRILLGCCLVVAGSCSGEAGDQAADTATEEADPAQQAPPSTDIWLAGLDTDDAGLPRVTDPVNVTGRPGYDNQPYFLPDGSGFWYTTIDELGEADIWRHDLAAGTNTAVTNTAPESEYSATPLPDGSGFSGIRVEADSTQRLWRFDADGGNVRVLFPDIVPVGYHKWVDENTAVMFVLGDPPTLQVGDLAAGTTEVVAERVGRSIQPIPGSDDVSFVQYPEGGGSEIRRFDPETGRAELIVEGIEGGDFHAWTPGGTLLQAYESTIYAWRPGEDGWTVVADLAGDGVRDVTRMSVSRDGSRIAIVGVPAGG